MNTAKFRSNATALTQELLNRGLSLAQAAKLAGLAPETLAASMRRDQKIALRTASKLRQAFGDDVIRCEFVQDEEPAELKISIESQPERRQKVFGELRGVISQMKAWRTELNAPADKINRALLNDALIAVYKFAGTFAAL